MRPGAWPRATWRGPLRGGERARPGARPRAGRSRVVTVAGETASSFEAPREPAAAGAQAPLAVLGGWTVGLLAVSIAAHRTPLYQVETDLVGEYIPAARELL